MEGQGAGTPSLNRAAVKKTVSIITESAESVEARNYANNVPAKSTRVEEVDLEIIFQSVIKRGQDKMSKRKATENRPHQIKRGRIGNATTRSWSSQFDLNLNHGGFDGQVSILNESSAELPCGCGYRNCRLWFLCWKDWFLHMLIEHHCNTAFGVITCSRCAEGFSSVVEHSKHTHCGL